MFSTKQSQLTGSNKVFEVKQKSRTYSGKRIEMIKKSLKQMLPPQYDNKKNSYINLKFTSHNKEGWLRAVCRIRNNLTLHNHFATRKNPKVRLVVIGHKIFVDFIHPTWCNCQSINQNLTHLFLIRNLLNSEENLSNIFLG